MQDALLKNAVSKVLRAFQERLKNVLATVCSTCRYLLLVSIQTVLHQNSLGLQNLQPFLGVGDTASEHVTRKLLVWTGGGPGLHDAKGFARGGFLRR